LHVVTQTIQKEWDWQPDKPLIINGENAIITVEAWDKNSIQATTELIAKHPDKQIAERDVQAQKAIAKTTKRNFLIGNQLVLAQGTQKPESNLKAKITIYAPQNCALQIKNRFGSIEVKGIKNTVEINSQFTKLNLEAVKGAIKLSSNFGDIIGQQLTGNVTIDANRSDIQLDHPSGNFTIAVFAHNFRLATEFGEIRLPINTAFKFIENSAQRKEAILNRKGNVSQISVALSFGDITFQ